MKSTQPQAQASRNLLFLDDLSVGQRFVSGSHAVSAEEIKEFAARYDPQPFHLDEADAAKTFFGGLAASGWLTAAIAMRLNVEGGLPIADGVIGLGGELSWPKPVRPGDTIHVESEVKEITPSRSKSDRGIVTIESRTLNQAGENVQIVKTKILVFRRPSQSDRREGST